MNSFLILLLGCGFVEMVFPLVLQASENLVDISTYALAKRASNTCPSGNYTTLIGQIFSTGAGNAGCGRDLLNNDILTVQQEDIRSLADCMDFCSANHDAAAYGVSYQFEVDPGICNCKNKSILTEDSKSNFYAHTALAVNLEDLNQTCPFTNGSIQDAADNSQYRIYCGQDMINVNDLCPITSPVANGTNLCPTHADSLQDCMNQCTMAHPICLAVTYTPAMIFGYGNCYFKNNVSTKDFVAWNKPGDTRHMAVLSSAIWNINSSCVNGTTYTSPPPQSNPFEIVCNTNNEAADVVVYHAQNMSACADMCAAYYNSSGVSCAGVVFDSTLGNGYQNCYIKSSIGRLVQSHGAHWIQLKEAAPSTHPASSSSGNANHVHPSSSSSSQPFAAPSSASTTPSSSPSSSSKTWTIGPVIGGLAGIAAVGVFLLWLRHRWRPSRSAQPSQVSAHLSSHSDQVQELDGGPKGQHILLSEADPAQAMHEADGNRTIHEAEDDRALYEVDGDQVMGELGDASALHEMPGVNHFQEDRSIRKTSSGRRSTL